MNDPVNQLVGTAINTLVEFAVAILPIIAIFYLRVSTHQRWQVMGLLSLGLFTTIVGCMRTYYLWKMYSTWDLTWWGWAQSLCAEIEVGLALVRFPHPHLFPYSSHIRKTQHLILTTSSSPPAPPLSAPPSTAS